MKRHLLPNEIDLLLDGEVGFGVTPLKAHVRTCEDCRTTLEEARTVVTALEHLPHLAPSPLFANRLMSQVQVFVPWHVAALDSARRYVPRSQPVRYLVGAGEHPERQRCNDQCHGGRECADEIPHGL